MAFSTDMGPQVLGKQEWGNRAPASGLEPDCEPESQAEAPPPSGADREAGAQVSRAHRPDRAQSWSQLTPGDGAADTRGFRCVFLRPHGGNGHGVHLAGSGLSRAPSPTLRAAPPCHTRCHFTLCQPLPPPPAALPEVLTVRFSPFISVQLGAHIGSWFRGTNLYPRTLAGARRAREGREAASVPAAPAAAWLPARVRGGCSAGRLCFSALCCRHGLSVRYRGGRDGEGKAPGEPALCGEREAPVPFSSQCGSCWAPRDEVQAPGSSPGRVGPAGPLSA